jgi:rhamnosyltransferase
MYESSKEKICILLASFNGEMWLPEQLDSIFNQTYGTVHLYVSDDLSRDNTPSLIKRYSNIHSNIILLPSGEKFGSAAKNFFRLLKSIDITQYDYIAFSDQDDIWSPEKLVNAAETIKNKKIDAYSSNVIAFWPDGKEKLISKAQAQTEFDFMFESAGPGCTFVLTQELALALQKLLIQEQETLDKIALHDWFIYAFARSKGYKWYIDSHPSLLYRQHAVNVIGANTGLKAIKLRLFKLKQGWYTEQILLIAKKLNYQNSLPIQKIARLNVLDRCYLAIFAHHFRRRIRDRVVFAFFILFLAKKP